MQHGLFFYSLLLAFIHPFIHYHVVGGSGGGGGGVTAAIVLLLALNADLDLIVVVVEGRPVK